jgi:thiosulfate reductase/polysulfide reductase chain A
MTITRRDLLQLAGGLSAGLFAGCTTPKSAGEDPAPQEQVRSGIDYSRAKALPTICFGCTTHCGVIGWVQDERVRLIEGNPLDPNTQGTVCSKANGMISYTYDPERLLYPLERVGKRGEGRWKRISWDEALAKVAARLRALREAGTPERFVFHYGRDKTKGFTKRFTNAYGTPNRLNRRSICSSNRRVPLMSFYGREFEWESQDLANTRYVLNFGGNPMEAFQGGLFQVRRLVDARAAGAKLITFEVRPSATASISDEFHVVHPASDGAIALALSHEIVRAGLADRTFWERWSNVAWDDLVKHLEPYTPEWAAEISGVDADTLRRLAREFAQAAPACTTLSNRGSAKHYNGVQNDRAIRMLDVLVGNVGKPGGFCLSTLRMWKERYGQWGLPVIQQPAPRPKGPKSWSPGTREFKLLPKAVQERVAAFPPEWQAKYFGELATPSEYPLSWHFYNMRVGQLVYPYIREGRAKVGAYMSYTLGAAFGYPEAHVAREVLKDEALIPFHVAIDISYSEQASLADIILPDATSLERWDAHSTNNYGLRPYTGIRQPLVEPLGEARPVQIILRDLARRIGGGMERHFEFEDLEDYYKAWYAALPISWEEFKRRGIWFDPKRPLDYELYERPLPKAEGDEVDARTGVIYRDKGGKRVSVGILKEGKAVRGFPTPTRRIQVFDPVFPLAAKHVGLPAEDVNAAALPTYGPVPEHVNLPSDRLILTTFKWNVHTQGRSAGWRYHSEIVHTNQAFLNPETAARLGLQDGDEVEITVYRPAQHTYRAGEAEPVGTFRNRVKLLAGVHPRVITCSHHMGHWEQGPIARADARRVSPGSPGMGPRDGSLAKTLWWAKGSGGVGNGVPLNDSLPINPTPLVGGQSWFDNVCSLRKI